MKENMKSFSELLEELRNSRQISKRELATRASLTPGYISHLTRGERTTPSEETVKALAEVLELDTETTILLFKAAGYSSYSTASDSSHQFLDRANRDKQKSDPTKQDWGEVPNVQVFYGRKEELAKLKQWIVDDHCQMIAVIGIGGVGKTILTAKLAEGTEDVFEYIFWRSLQNAPSIEKILRDFFQLFSEHQRKDLPEDIDGQIGLLIKLLREHRCLLVLDNFESVLQENEQVGNYREGYEGYGRLLKVLGEAKHQSCLLLTSREKLKEVAHLEGNSLPVRSFQLLGIGQLEGREILKDKGLFGSDESWINLIQLYSGNPLALKLVSESIREVFGRNIASFLNKGETIFGDIRYLLEKQFQRLSELEREILFWLAIEREAVSLEGLQEDLIQPVSDRDLLEAVGSLRRRSIIEIDSNSKFFLQAIIMEYMTNKFVEQVSKELEEERLDLFASHVLIKAQAKDYVRISQIRLILTPVAKQLLTTIGNEGIVRKCKSILVILREMNPQKLSYAAGNLINLLVHLKCDLHGLDFSHLIVRQAYLQGVALPDVNFTHANFVQSVFTETFGSILSIGLNSTGELLAAGTANREVRLWQLPTGTPLLTCQGHTDWVWSVTFSPDSQILATGSSDQTIRLWEVSSGQCLKVLRGHTNLVRSIAFSPDGQLLASGGEDETIRLWEVSSGQCLKVLQGHTSRLRSVAFSPDGQLLASGGEDETIHLWEVSSGQCLKVLSYPTHRVYSVAFSPDGQLLASGGEDETIRLWEVSSGQCLKVLRGHTNWVRSVTFSPNGQTLASGGEDETIRLWEVSSGQCLKVLRGHTNWVRSVTFSPNGQTLATGSDDQTVRLWDVNSGQPLKVLYGQANRIRSVTFSPDSQILATGSSDQTIRLWEVSSGQCLKVLQGHTSRLRSVAFSPDGQLLASGGEDETIRLWEVGSGQCLKVLRGHDSWVWSTAFSPDGNIVISGSDDRTIRMWDVSSGQCLKILHGHTDQVRSVAFSPNRQFLASGSNDGTIKLWEVSSGQCLRTLQAQVNRVYTVVFNPDGQTLASCGDDQIIRMWEVSSGQCLKVLHGHDSWIYSVAFSPNGHLLASGSNDQTIRLWEVSSGQCLKVLHGHDSWVYSVAFSPNGHLLASGSNDGTIKLWNTTKGEYLTTMRSDRPYEGMNISYVSGLTETQKVTLRALGAIENYEK